MKPVLTLITPEIARGFLTKVKGWHRIDQRKLEKYKDMMINGQWKDRGGTPIKISNGYLIDGNHRMTAIVETGKSYNMMLYVVGNN